jgi:pyrroline-5-carboxylate reductase
MSVNKRRIAVLGTGKMGEALIKGLCSSGSRQPSEIVATDIHPERLQAIAELCGVATSSSNREAVKDAGLIVIAVKPQDLAALAEEIGDQLTSDQTLLSVAAAVRTVEIERHLPPGIPVVRAMPNTPATVLEAMTGIAPGAHAGEESMTLADEVLSAVGAVVRVHEEALDAVTAVSGSGPAYFALLAEAMIEAGILLGLARDISTKLVVQTMFGTAKLLRDTGIHPVELRENVTSPGGTTIRAIRELERAGVRAAFLNAIQAAMERSRELAEGDK